MTAPGPELEKWYGYTGQRLVANQPYTGPNGSPAAANRAIFFAQGPGVASLPLNADDEQSQALAWIPSGADESRPLSTVAFHPHGNQIAVADTRLHAQVAIYSWPERRQVHKLDQAARLAVADMAWSRKATHFAILSAAPLHNLTVYAVDANTGRLGQLVVGQKDQPNEHQYNSVSFSPRSALELCTSGGGHVAFWRIDTGEDAQGVAHGAATLDCVEGSVATPGSWRMTSHAWLAQPHLVAAGTTSGHIFLFDTTTGVGSLAPVSAAADGTPIQHDAGATVAITVTKHNVIALSADGTLRFYAPDMSQEIREVSVPVVSPATTMAFTAHDTFAIGTSGGEMYAVTIPGYGTAGSGPGGLFTAEELRLAAPRVHLAEEGFGTNVVAACALPASSDSTHVVALSSDGVLRVRDTGKNRLELRMHVGEQPSSMILLPPGSGFGAITPFGGPSHGATTHVFVAAFATGTIRFIEITATSGTVSGRVAQQIRVTTERDQHHVEQWHDKSKAPGCVDPPAFRLFQSPLGYGSAARQPNASMNYVIGVFGLYMYIVDPSTRTAVAIVRVPPAFEGVHDVAFYPASTAATLTDLHAVLSTYNSTIILIKIPGDVALSAGSSTAGSTGVTFESAPESTVPTSSDATGVTTTDDASATSPSASAGHELALPALHWDRLVVNRWRGELPMLRIAVLAVFEGSINMFGQSVDRETKFFAPDLTLAASRKDADTKALKLPVVFPDHAKGCSSVTSLDGRLLLTTGTDGRLTVRNVAALAQQGFNPKDGRKEGAFVVTRHPSSTGGVKLCSISSTGRHLVTVGGEGTVILWNFAPVGIPGVQSRGSASSTMTFPWRPFTTTVVYPRAGLPRQPEEPLFFLEARRREAEEADRIRHESHRAEVLAKVNVLREKLRVVRKENELAAEEEKVDTESFLVQRDLSLFQSEVAKAVAHMRDETKYGDLMADFIASTLKKECWDSMSAKLTPIFGMANKNLKVYSCHQLVNDPARVALLRKVKFLRRVEEADRAVRGVSELTTLTAGSDAANAEDEKPHEVVNPLAGRNVDLDDKMPPLEQEYAEDVEPYLYRPLLTYTRQRAVSQIRLLEAKTGNIVKAFNSRFAEMVLAKKNEIAKIRERNLRCTLICRELEQQPNFFVCEMAREETPETLLDVTDAEVPADKSHDPTEMARVAAEEAERERWRRQHGNDDSSERALKQWMDGRLEKEIKTLTVDVPLPEFAVEGGPKFVPETDRNDEQQKQWKEYEKRRAKREEEVATRRKLLQTELGALQKENLDAANKYDQQLGELLVLRIDGSQQLYRVDLQRVKLVQSIALHRDRTTVLAQLERLRSSLNAKLVRASQLNIRFRKDLDAKREQLAQLTSDEKAAERGLRTMEPFNENEDAADRLAKMYAGAKKKALAAGAAGGREGGNRAVKGKAKLQVEDPHAAVKASFDPFAFIDAEIEAKNRAQNDEGGATAAQFAKLDRSMAGEIVPDHLWDAFQGYLQDRLEGEKQMRRLQQQVTDMTAEELRLTEAEDALRAAAVQAAEDLNNFRRDARDEAYDVDELRLYRQGQVEVAQAPVVTDYADAVLIHVRDIHALNAAIRQRGTKKVDAMKAMNAQRAEARFLEWELEKLQYQCDTLELECRHLHTLRVTKQMQEFIHGGGEGYNERERAKLAQKIEHVRTTMSTKIEEKKQLMAKVKRATKEREIENSLLVDQVTDAESLVQSRRSVRDLQSSELERERHARLMRDMRVTRKLEDVAKAQQEEMEALRKEVDRLRERTFPSFAVVSKRVIGNPDERQS